MTKYVDVGALQMVWMTIWLSSQLVLAFADEYWHFIAGMILFACGVSGYSGLKYVIHYDLVGGKYMQYIIAYGKSDDYTCPMFPVTPENPDTFYITF